MMDKLTKHLDNGDFMFVFLDFSKASYTVDHDILARKFLWKQGSVNSHQC